METDDGRPTSAQSGADCSDAACLFVWSGWSCRASQTDADTADGRTDRRRQLMTQRQDSVVTATMTSVARGRRCHDDATTRRTVSSTAQDARSAARPSVSRMRFSTADRRLEKFGYTVKGVMLC